ncbi:uncharacterized protein K452DRAFT_123583 [Aplosporella prunicola CBS 121167]|uniref:Uncharacterized protein n=1 Tax=Aplosporella prunicola CBS 121167 TaxID=1176127 RepID=A0A6A6BNH6_9PEZI|nr:uncharacterized protein K452DRAFT_123583 [Aplosporella prunicola CBS 121167]KAF2145662.1 hypothetical protein K452DRAFT_123583 [Aplosporella prunicola CBS 121167]
MLRHLSDPSSLHITVSPPPSFTRLHLFRLHLHSALSRSFFSTPHSLFSAPFCSPPLCSTPLCLSSVRSLPPARLRRPTLSSPCPAPLSTLHSPLSALHTNTALPPRPFVPLSPSPLQRQHQQHQLVYLST